MQPKERALRMGAANVAVIDADNVLAATVTRHLQANDLNGAFDVLREETKRRSNSEVAQQLGISTVALWQILNYRRQPRLTTFMRLLEVFELQLSVTPQKTSAAPDGVRFAPPRGGAPWRDEELEVLRRMNAGGESAADIARVLGRSIDAVSSRLS